MDKASACLQATERIIQKSVEDSLSPTNQEVLLLMQLENSSRDFIYFLKFIKIIFSDFIEVSLTNENCIHLR